MEQILTFVLGASVITFVWVVAVVFKTAKLANTNRKDILNIQEHTFRNEEVVHRRIDQEIDRTDKIFDECIKYTDSRTDKLESKVIEKQILKK